MKSKSELRLIAKEKLVEAISIAYYKIADDDDSGLTEEEKDAVYEYINAYGKSMCKAIGRNYYTV